VNAGYDKFLNEHKEETRRVLNERTEEIDRLGQLLLELREENARINEEKEAVVEKNNLLLLKVQLLTEMAATASLDEERFRFLYEKEVEEKKILSAKTRSPNKRPHNHKSRHRDHEENSY
jgi:hypothetical protein